MASPNGPLQRCNSTQDVSTQSKIAPPDATISRQRPLSPCFARPENTLPTAILLTDCAFVPNEKEPHPFRIPSTVLLSFWSSFLS